MNANKFYLKGARLSYTKTLFTPEVPKGSTGGAKYSVGSIIEPSTQGFYGDANPDSETGKAKGYKWADAKTELAKAVIATAQAQWKERSDDVLQQLKATNRLPLHDGAEKGNQPGYAGHKYINASSTRQPMVMARNGQQIREAQGIIYSGCYGDVVLDIWAQDNQHGKRVNAALIAVVFSHDGDKLAGGLTATADDFATIPEQSSPAAEKSGAAALF